MAKYPRRTKEELAKLWSSVPAEVKKKLTRAVATNAKELQAAIKAAAPVDDGDLKAGIKDTDTSGAEGYIRHTVKTHSPKPASAKYRHKGYATYIEYGTERQEKDPFFFPTFNSLKPKFEKRNKSAIRRGMKQAMKNG